MYLLAKLIHKVWPDYIHLNYYIHSPRATLNKYPQLSESLREYHLKIFLNRLREPNEKYKYLELHPVINIRHYFIWGKRKSSRKWIKEQIRIDEKNSITNNFPINMPFKRIMYIYHESGYKKLWKDYF